MKPFTTLTGVAAPLDIMNVDTDMIIPKQYLKTIKRTGLGTGLFSEMRYKDDGSENPDFVLNKAAYRKAEILVAGDNFGCGSSREHAPWALLDFGIRCVISTSFADIFYGNCFKNGILPIKLPQEQVDKLMDDAERGANALFPSEAVEIRAFADSIARRSDSEEAVLSNTIAAVHARLAFDPGFVIANGLDVLRRGRGTCVAYATLTATTLRALGYPSRVVYGYAYASGQFVGHAWTEVWSQDHWRGLDAALYADDSFDSARIALARSHGADGAGGGLDALGRTFGRFSVTLLDFEVAASEPPVGR